MERTFYTFSLNNKPALYSHLLYWAKENYSSLAFLNSSHAIKDPYSSGYDAILAVGARRHICPDENTSAFSALKDFSDQNNDWIFGFLSYDLKNQLENLKSENADSIRMPLMHFFVPEIVFLFKGNEVKMGILSENEYSGRHNELWETASGFTFKTGSSQVEKILHRVNRDEYIRNVEKIKNHIQIGDIYEANYCIEFFSESAEIDPAEAYLRLNLHNPAPFSCFYKLDEKYLISSSPERFLARRGKKLVSQPIKGTIKRGKTSEEDKIFKNKLLNDPKERSENVMIVDLVRNDLSRSAERGSVKVEELFGIYTYPRVHQMISTVTATLKNDMHFVDAIRIAFPMGSMTGAPKIRAMELIEDYEATRRGLYSGTVGYIDPEKDFDFNVIIRSILYNHTDKFLSFMAGSAITIESDPEKEYEECLLKAGSMAYIINTNLQ
ncbi:MAG: aminodeoxychorismate synthase component I [Bacteroidales bacterium]|nr:aminodeoxychorismate synthase component I [Bacteroidales bacterium]